MSVQVAPVPGAGGGRLTETRGSRFGALWFGRVAVVVIVSLATIGLAVPAPAAAQGHDADAESTFIALVNEVRAEAGVAPLAVDSQLRGLARAWTAEMHAGNCGGDAHICHAGSLSAGVTHEWAKLGENVGTGPNVDSVTEAFINSPGHYANILDPEFTHIGVGVMWDGARLYTTHRFMASVGAPAPAAPEPEPTPEPAPAPEPTPTLESAPVDAAPAPGAPAGASDAVSEPQALPAPTAVAVAPPARPDRVAVMVDALDAVGA